ncbi:MAG: hypothetical protein IPP52_16000 [Ignavibacteria bacterium]|nr:hypothetical protein [Ignavibacteria bacterium]
MLKTAIKENKFVLPMLISSKEADSITGSYGYPERKTKLNVILSLPKRYLAADSLKSRKMADEKQACGK